MESIDFAAGPEPNGHGGAVTSLAMVIATSLADAHSSGQYITGLVALAPVLTHDAMVLKRQIRIIRRHLVPRARRPGQRLL